MTVISTIIVDEGHDYYHTSSRNMDHLNKIFSFVFLSYWLQRDRDGTGSGSYGSGIDHCAAGPGREWE